MKAVLTRLKQENEQTLGSLEIWDGIQKLFECSTLELPWKNNERKVSCIPVGTYKSARHNSVAHGLCFHVKDVPGRSEILIHKGNFHRDTLGCILVGSGFVDINHDGETDLVGSGKTMEKLLASVNDEFELIVI